MGTLAKRNSIFPTTNTLLDDFFSKVVFDWSDKNFSTLGSNLPSANLRETDSKLEVDLAAPAMKKEDFKVEIDNHTLMISSEKKRGKRRNKKKRQLP